MEKYIEKKFPIDFGCAIMNLDEFKVLLSDPVIQEMFKNNCLFLTSEPNEQGIDTSKIIGVIKDIAFNEDTALFVIDIIKEEHNSKDFNIGIQTHYDGNRFIDIQFYVKESD